MMGCSGSSSSCDMIKRCSIIEKCRLSTVPREFKSSAFVTAGVEYEVTIELVRETRARGLNYRASTLSVADRQRSDDQCVSP